MKSPSRIEMKSRMVVTTTHQTRKRPRGTLFVEMLFFTSLAVFGFVGVAILLGLADRPIIHVLSLSEIAPRDFISGEETIPNEYGLYEAASTRPLPEPVLSQIFTPSVLYWQDSILIWAAQYDLDPNLVATVMQIESCGWPRATSSAGAMGLFQVMPFHFSAGEEPYEPTTNAFRGMTYLHRGLEISKGHAGLALAGYNGGHSVINKDYSRWSGETKRYYRWGSGIYREAAAGWETSPTLNDWYTAAGRSMCNTAEAYLGID